MSRTAAQLVGLSSSFARCDCAAPIASIEPERAADLLLALVDGAEVASALGESSERLLPGVEAVLELVLGARKEGPPG